MGGSEILDAQELALSNERLREQQRAISSVLRAVARAAGLQPVLDEVIGAARQLCDGEYGSLHLLHGNLLPAVSCSGSFEQWEYDKGHPHTLDRTTIVGRTAVSRSPVHIPDLLTDPEYSYPGPRTGIRAGLGVPVLFEDELIGVMGIVRAEPEPFTDEQIQLVQTFADQAAIAIANARLIDAVERQRTELSRFVSPRVAELLSSEQGEQLLAGHRAYITCLFCDLRGFTAFAETSAPEELFELLCEYHTTVGELIPAYDGTLEHFAGDGLMVFFNDLVTVEDHELQAIRMALGVQERFDELADTWRKRGFDLGLGVGVAAGYATLGRIGFEGRYDYGALGPVTNLASRLSTYATPGQVLISQRVFAEVENVVDAEPVGEIELKGFGRAVAAYEIRGLH